MSIPTVTITGNVLPPNNVAAGGTVSFELNTVAVDLGSGVVVPRKVSTPILSGGAISQAIWPNAAGENPSRYAVYLEMIPALDGDCPVRIKLGEIVIPVSPSSQDIGALIAAGASATGGAALLEFQFANRAALVAKVASGLVPIPGFTYLAGGLSYLGKAGATGISDLPGLVPAGAPHFRHYGAAGNNSTDDTAACQAALTAHPGEFLDGEGLTYRINGTLAGSKVRNAKFRKTSTGSLFRAFGSAGAPFAADADFNRGSTQIQSATLAAALSVGDWFAVIAENDPYSGFLSGTSGGKSGELVQVHSISGSTVTITRPLLWTYSTTKRLVMFTWLEGVEFENCDFEMAGMETSDPGTGLFDDDAQCIDVRFALRPRFVECRFHDGRQAGILTHGCVGTIVDACHFYNLASDPTATTGVGLGYGVHERGMNSGATVTGCSSDNIRTLYTTGAGLSAIWAYGVPVGSVCSGNTMNNHRVGSGASTHEAGAFVKITGNTITNCGSGSIIRAKWCDVSGNTFSLIQGPAVNVVNNGSTSVAQGATIKDNVIFRSNLTVQTNEGAIDDNSPDAVIDGNIIRQCAGPAVQINFTLRSVVTNNIVIDPCQLSGTHGVEYAIGGTGTGAGTPFWTVSGNVIISTDGLCTIGVNKPLNVIVRGAGNTCVGIASEYSGEFGNLELGFTGRPNYGSRDNSEVISGGAINVEAATSGFITLQAESGSADDLNTITGGVPGDEVILRSVSGHTITLKAGTGTTTDNIRTQSGSDVVLTFNPTGAAIIAKAVRMDNVWIIQ